jgi:hypothetical protein
LNVRPQPRRHPVEARQLQQANLLRLLDGALTECGKLRRYIAVNSM